MTEIYRRDDSLAQPGPGRKRKPRIGWVVILILVVFLGSGIVGFRLAGLLAVMPPSGLIPSPFVNPKPMSIVVMGSDQRGEALERSDTLMLVSITPAAVPTINVLSIPRDTYVRIPGHGANKINAALAYGGPSLAMDTVEDLLGVSVDNYVVLDFNDFVSIVDTLGGIELDVDRRMYRPSEGIDLKPGPQQLLNGEDALAYVRFRDYPEGDIERIRHQEHFLMAVADGALSWKGLLNSPRLIQDFYSNIKTDLAMTDLLTLAKSMRNLDSSQVSVTMLPGTPRYIDGISYWVTDPKEVKAVVASLTTPPSAGEAQAAPEK